MAAVLRQLFPDPGPPDVRAKSLRPDVRGLRLETRAALQSYGRALSGEDDRGVRRAAGILCAALLVEARDPASALPSGLREHVERWDDGLFAGTDVDLEVADRALDELFSAPGDDE